jgi:galactose-1-phosphate uridylyltransferase
MEEFFKTRATNSRMLDSATEFSEKAIPLEVRTDLFTGRVSRILGFRFQLPKTSHDPDLIEASRTLCPFCPENIEVSTPQFPVSITAEGRIRFGRSIVLPNAFPYSRHCGVVVFSEQHYMPLDRITSETLFDALKASVVFIESVSKSDRRAAYASINWNYMQAAGGGLVHPHFQAVVNESPTNFHYRLIKESADYKKTHESNYWYDLISFEQQNKSRYLFRCDNIDFLASFSPGGMFGEVLAVFRRMTSVRDITDDVWKSFSIGLSRVLRCFSNMHLDSLNMTILMGLEQNNDFWIQARIIPRINLPPWGTSDINYFEKGHDEIIVILSPEDLAKEIRKTE